MSAILAGIFSLLSTLPGVMGNYFKQKQEIETLKIQTNAQIEIARQNALQANAASDATRAVAALGATGMWFKYVVFWLLASPFIGCFFGYTAYATQVFANLSQLPQWYLIIFTGIIGVIWGIPVPGSMMGNIWEGIGNSVQSRRDYKIDKIKASTFDETAFYKKLNELGFHLTQQQVDGLNKAITIGEEILETK